MEFLQILAHAFSQKNNSEIVRVVYKMKYFLKVHIISYGRN